jgi:site-specific recombinase XerD
MVTEIKTKNITLDELIDAFLGATSHLSPHTQRYYRTYLKGFRWYAHEFNWPEVADEITRDHIRQFLNYVGNNTNRWGHNDPTRSSSRRAAPGTTFHYGVVVKRLFRWATDEEEYLKENGIWRLKLPSPHFRQVEPYTDTEVMSMLEACEEEYRFRSRFLGSRNKAIIAVFCDTGIRLSEMAGIRLADLHSSLKQLRVTGKGQKTRIVPLQGESMKSLNRYIMYRPETDSDWLWLSDEGDRLTADSITTMVERLKKRAGVSSDGLVHRFRHYFATRYLEAGGNVNSLRLLLGHESFAMVLHYTKLVNARRAVSEHGQFSPLNQLYEHRNRDDGWGWHKSNIH